MTVDLSKKPIINTKSELIIEQVLNNLPHSLLISGPYGVGLSTITRYYVKKSDMIAWWVLPEKDSRVDVEKGSVTVEQIRSLYETTKTINRKGRLIVIDNAEKMTLSAQHAFLKLLEEPTSGTHFVLLTSTPGALLPTVLSRVQHVALRPCTRQQSEDFISSLNITDSSKKAQLMFIAEGRPAELYRLINDDKIFNKRVEIVRDARSYISEAAYSRLKLALKYKDDRLGALTMLEDAQKQLRTTLASYAKNDNHSIVEADKLKRNLATIQRIEQLHQRIYEQGNVRLQLSAGVVL